MANTVSDLLGQEGLDYFADTNANTPPTGLHWNAIKAIDGAVEVDSVSLNSANVASITDNFTIPDGGTFFGEITALTLASGKVICYRSAL